MMGSANQYVFYFDNCRNSCVCLKNLEILLDYNLVNITSNVEIVTKGSKVFELLTEHLQRIDETDDSIFTAYKAR